MRCGVGIYIIENVNIKRG